MTFKILHTSDWHLGQNFYGKNRIKEHTEFLDWLVEQVEVNQVNAIIVAGDVFDTGTPPSYAREMYYNFIVRIHQLACQLIVLAGNHDSVSMLAESKGMASHLSCHVIAQPQANIQDQIVTITDSNDQPLGVICAVPFLRPKDIQQSSFGQSASEKQHDLRQQIAAHYLEIYNAATQIAGDHAIPIIATGHLTAVGAKMSESVRDIYIGTLDAVPASDFPPADYIALGHIHRPQKVAKSEHIRYCGSPIPLSFDEASTIKQVNLVCFDKGQLLNVTPLKIPSFQFLATLKTSMSTLVNDVELAIEAFGDNFTEQSILWLDIEVSTADYLSDLGAKIEELTASLPVEVLRIRRTKSAKEQSSIYEEKITLDELSVAEVFDAKLSTIDVSDDAQADRLKTLYMQTVEQIKTPPEDESNSLQLPVETAEVIQ
ncbi:exonuclease subunit SbcD [Thalassotalea fusca]